MLRRQTTGLIIAGNTVGAFLTYYYFSTISASGPRLETHAALPYWYYDLFFPIGTVLLVFTFAALTHRTLSPLYAVIQGTLSLDEVPASRAAKLKRQAFQHPALTAGVSFLVWILAGFLFGLLEPLITQTLFDIPAPPLAECLR